ncbi:hypothetical protein PF011_g18447 [Phytophthora fragariae]|uniref:OTU domain-containing protein n=1 Tax=Phytophthora fragariae TaxID=53985 RepID=A0A6A3J4I9_9STRA|nr:hypothetical protein PF011_g18447 [Phytophthora fragariae]
MPRAPLEQAVTAGTESCLSPGQASDGCVTEEAAEADIVMTSEAESAQGTADADMLNDVDSELSGYVGSSAPSHTQSPAPTPGSEYAYSLASDTMADLTTVETNRQESLQTEAGVTTSNDEVGGPTDGSNETSLSQDGYIIEKVQQAPGMPQQWPVFLLPFRGALTSVPANGQCAYTALYATMSSSDETKLLFTSEVVKGVNIVKRSVYTLMMANLANDVACHVVDPCEELRRLYPSQPPPTDVNVATAALYTHYAQERIRTVNAPIPTAFWAGSEVLRTMAQYLREPLFVLDVNNHNDAHLHRYYYKDYMLPNGDIHETGCGGAMDDKQAKAMLEQYARLHVMPVFMVLKRYEGHFYGVHHGEVSTKWQAEGDPDFASTNCASHDWYAEVVAQSVQSDQVGWY